MTKGHPTIHDVARRAGVSKSLVSLVMRDAPNVSDSRRAAVKKAAAELGYRPNAAAKNLVRGRSFVIGVVVADLRNPFFTDIVDSIAEATAEAEYRTLIGAGFQSATREAESVDTLLQLRVDGLILGGSHLSITDIEIAAHNAPVVLISRATRSDAVDSVMVDERLGSKLAVDHLTSLGHRRIAHLHGGPGAGAKARLSGYKAAMKANGLADRVQTVAGNYTEEGGAIATRSLLSGPNAPTAIFAGNDFSALGALSAARELGLRVPHDLSIIGFDNTSLSGVGPIQLSTIDQPGSEIAYHAVSLLFERLEGRSEGKRIVVQPTLVERATTGPVPTT